MGKQSRYSKECKEQALTLIRKGDRTLKQISKMLGVNYWTLREWKSELEQIAPDSDGELNVNEREELRKLRGELQDLRMENAILKKYAAILSRDQL